MPAGTGPAAACEPVSLSKQPGYSKALQCSTSINPEERQ